LPALAVGVEFAQAQLMEHVLEVASLVARSVVGGQRLLRRPAHAQLAANMRDDDHRHVRQRHRVAQALHQFELQH